jgi:hypothetical protein
MKVYNIDAVCAARYLFYGNVKSMRLLENRFWWWIKCLLPSIGISCLDADKCVATKYIKIHQPTVIFSETILKGDDQIHFDPSIKLISCLSFVHKKGTNFQEIRRSSLKICDEEDSFRIGQFFLLILCRFAL